MQVPVQLLEGQVEKADTVGRGHGHGHEPKFIFQPFSALCSVGQKLNIIHSLNVACLASLLFHVLPRVSRGQRPRAYLISFNNESSSFDQPS